MNLFFYWDFLKAFLLISYVKWNKIEYLASVPSPVKPQGGAAVIQLNIYGIPHCYLFCALIYRKVYSLVFFSAVSNELYDCLTAFYVDFFL